MSAHTDNERSEAAVDVPRLVRLLDSCKYWQGVSECECHSLLPTGGCFRCDMDEAVELLSQIVEANAEVSRGHPNNQKGNDNE